MKFWIQAAVSLAVVFAVVGSVANPVKPPLVGLVTMGDESWLNDTNESPQNRLREAYAHPGVYSAAVIEATWSQLEPQQGIFYDSVISNALLKLAAYNAQYPSTPLTGKLRVFAGLHTPAWVLPLTGSVAVTTNNTVYTLPDFWTTTYSSLWTALQNHLAAAFDTNQLLGEVAITVGSSITAEPFVVPGNFIPELANAGYTVEQMEQCLSNAGAVYAAWQRTPLDYTFNPTFDKSSGADTPFSIQVMQAFRQALGTRAVVANHDLDDPLFSTNYGPMYAEFQTLDAAAVAADPPAISPLEFQTAGPDVDWAMVAPFAIRAYHPTEIEVWNTTAVTTPPAGAAPVTLEQLQEWNWLLRSAPIKIGFTPGGGFELAFYGATGSNYSLQASSDLTHWTSVCSFTSTNFPATAVDTTATNFSRRFYQILP